MQTAGTPALRLTGEVAARPARFDSVAWRQAVRGSGLLAVLTRSELAVLWFAYDHASRETGQVDLPRGYMGEVLGMSVKAARDACVRLVDERGLLTLAGKSAQARGVNRYRLAWPPGPPEGGRAASMDAAESGVGRRGDCLSESGSGGKWASPRGEVGFRLGGKPTSPKAWK